MNAQPLLRITALPVWAEKETTPRRSSQFSASYPETLQLLMRELAFLDATEVTLAVVAAEAVVRRDGQLRADARINHPGVILAFNSSHGRLRYVTDTFVASPYTSSWQANLRAAALGLEALRKIDRYGISSSGEQYRGWTEITATAHEDVDLDVAQAKVMSKDQAARWLLAHLPSTAGAHAEDLLTSASARNRYIKLVSRQMHPDTGGSPQRFQVLQEIKRVLDRVD